MSYFEWVQDIGWLFWTEEQVRNKLKDVMFMSFDKVWQFSEEFPNKSKGKYKDLRMSAMGVSLMRLEKAMKLRGQAW